MTAQHNFSDGKHFCVTHRDLSEISNGTVGVNIGINSLVTSVGQCKAT